MTAPKYRLPNRKWYTLPQAIKQIYKLTGEEIEVRDLFHYWINNKIEIYTHVQIDDNVFILGDIHLSNNELDIFTSYRLGGNELLVFETVDKIFEYGQPQKIRLKHIREEIRNRVFKNKKQQEDFINKLFPLTDDCHSRIIHGFLAISNTYYLASNVEEYFEANGFCIDDIVYLTSPNGVSEYEDNSTYEEKIIFNVGFGNRKEGKEINKYISVNKLYIFHNDLENFLQGNFEEAEKTAEIIKTQQAPKTLNAQAKFIKDLIISEYGEDVAQNIRSELDNPHSPMRIAMEAKGLKPPSGKTVQKWINEN